MINQENGKEECEGVEGKGRILSVRVERIRECLNEF